MTSAPESEQARSDADRSARSSRSGCAPAPRPPPPERREPTTATRTLCAICTVRVDSRDASTPSAPCTSPAVSSVSRANPTPSRRAFPVVSRYKPTARADSPSSPTDSQSSRASPPVYRRRGRSPLSTCRWSCAAYPGPPSWSGRHLLPDARLGRAEPRLTAPTFVLGRVPVDRVLALPRCPVVAFVIAPFWLPPAPAKDSKHPVTSAPGRIRTRDPLLRRHLRWVSGGVLTSPDMWFSCVDGG